MSGATDAGIDPEPLVETLPQPRTLGDIHPEVITDCVQSRLDTIVGGCRGFRFSEHSLERICDVIILHTEKHNARWRTNATIPP